MYKFWINNIFFFNYIKKNMLNMTIFQKCFELNLDLPCFCYHENLSIAGNCRMCLVEINTSLKLVIACAMPMQNNIKIYTNNYRVKKARESILEFLLINHPLDCPICDQGGECDLQDITLIYGSDKSRFYEYYKRSIIDKECNSLIKMIMTRCIHCTRCIRFLNEITNNYEFGILNRGKKSEINTFLKKSINNELSGNIIDLCPVGALTSKPFSFVARPWELNNLESIDILDSIGTNIRIDYLNNKIYRILPIYNKNINEDWITNKIRFIYDSCEVQRLYFSLINIKKKFIKINWIDSFFFFFFNLNLYKNREIFTYFGNFIDIESIINMKNFFDLIGLEIRLISNFLIDNDFRENFYFYNYNLNEYLNYLIIGIDLRIELPLLNSKIIKLSKKKNIYNFFNKNSFGLFFNNELKNFKKMIFFKSIMNIKFFYRKFSYLNFNVKYIKFKNSLLFLIGLNFFKKNNDYLIFLLNKNFLIFFKKIKILKLLSNISYLNFFEIGLKNKFNNNLKKNINNLIFLNNISDEIFLKKLKNKNFIIYSGSFYDIGAKCSNLILPIKIFFEYSGFFFNIEKKLKYFKKIIDFKKIYILSILFKNFIIYYKINYFFYFFKNFFKIFYFFKNFFINWNLKFNYYKLSYIGKNIKKNKLLIKLFNNNLFLSYIYNYYKNEDITKNSKNLNLMSLEYLNKLFIFFKNC